MFPSTLSGLDFYPKRDVSGPEEVPAEVAQQQESAFSQGPILPWPDAAPPQPPQRPNPIASAFGAVGRGIGYGLTGNPYFLAKPQLDEERAREEYNRQIRMNDARHLENALATDDFKQSQQDLSPHMMAGNLADLSKASALDQKPEMVAKVRETDGMVRSQKTKTMDSALTERLSPSQAAQKFAMELDDSDKKEFNDLLQSQKLIERNMLHTYAQTGDPKDLANWKMLDDKVWEHMQNRFSDQREKLAAFKKDYNAQTDRLFKQAGAERIENIKGANAMNVAQINAEGRKGKGKSSWDYVDKDFAKEYSDFILKGGSSTVSNQLVKLEDAIHTLDTDKSISGAVRGAFPDAVRSMTNPKAVDLKEQMRSVVYNTLRPILGAQFTQKEGEAVVNTTYNDRLPPKTNARRARLLMAKIKSMAQNKLAAAKYFEENDTMRGYSGHIPSMEDLSNLDRELMGADARTEKGKSIGSPSDNIRKRIRVLISSGKTPEEAARIVRKEDEGAQAE